MQTVKEALDAALRHAGQALGSLAGVGVSAGADFISKTAVQLDSLSTSGYEGMFRFAA